jgi:hypothetical protein
VDQRRGVFDRAPQSFRGLDPEVGLFPSRATAYNTLALLPFTSNLSGHDLGTSGTTPIGTLTPGVYKFSTSAQLNGTLTLDAQHLTNALFVFQIGTTLTTASASNVMVINNDPSDGIYWLAEISSRLPALA